MRHLSLVFAALLSLFFLPSANWAKPPIKSDKSIKTCVRHAVGFFTSPEVLGELAQVYTNCYPQPVCNGPTDLETIQIDGYSDASRWLWSGPPNTSFNETKQNSIIDAAIARANENGVKPSGKEVVNIVFFKDITVPIPPTPSSSVIYCKVTFARCSQPQKKGMTWLHSKSDATTGTITVGCSGCNASHGDTVCTELRPLLCIYKPTPPFQLPKGLDISGTNNLWSGGVVATTQPVAGNTFADITDANSYCEDKFGKGWRVAEFHDGGIWNFQAYGGTVSAPTVPSTRFWVSINDQTDGNCWTIPSAGDPSTTNQ